MAMATTKSPKELLEERRARVEAAINLEEPDRVPYSGLGGDIIPAFAGITHHEYCYDYEKTREATIKFHKEFPCDWSFASGFTGVGVPPLTLALADKPDLAVTFGINGNTHDILGDVCTKYPGRELGENSSPQFIGGTFMEPEEYDQLAQDPVGFTAEVVLPRICKNLRNPRDAAATWVRMGMEAVKAAAAGQQLAADMEKIGIPTFPLGFGMVPLDMIGDGYRDFTNVMLDLRRYPDKVKKACDAMLEHIINIGLSLKPMGAKIAFIALHLNEYLSPKLYKDFYWPYLKEIITRYYEEGIKSLVFFEGQHEHHLETILELPRGWGVAYFEKTDVVKAKEVLKDHTCIMGGVPISLIVTGTPAQIDSYVKDLMEKMKPGGGYILCTSVGSAPRETPLENIKALIEAVEKYGSY